MARPPEPSKLEYSFGEYWPVLWWSRKLWDGSTCCNWHPRVQVAQGRPVHSSHEHLASPRLVLPFPWHYFVTFATLSSVLTAFLLLGNRKTVLVITTQALKQKPFSAVTTETERGVAKTRTLITREELDPNGRRSVAKDTTPTGSYCDWSKISACLHLIGWIRMQLLAQ